jgi:hypothetical protein
LGEIGRLAAAEHARRSGFIGTEPGRAGQIQIGAETLEEDSMTTYTKTYTKTFMIKAADEGYNEQRINCIKEVLQRHDLSESEGDFFIEDDGLGHLLGVYVDTSQRADEIAADLIGCGITAEINEFEENVVETEV